MCMACGQMFSSIHWSDQLKTDDGGFVDQRTLFRTRQMKVDFTNSILSYYGIGIRSRAGGGYTIYNKTGKQVLCKDFGEIWSQIDKLCGRKVDPLDSGFLSFLTIKSKEGDI